MITHILFNIDDTLMDYYTAEMNVKRVCVLWQNS